MALGVGANDIRALAVANDSAGNVLVTGTFQGTADFDPTSSLAAILSGGDYDAFVAKYSSTGGLLWARSFVGGSSGSVGQGSGIAVDSSGNCFLTGEFSGPVDFDPGPGTFLLNSTGRFDGFVAKLDSSGNLVWAKDLAGSAGAVDSGTAIVVDGQDRPTVTGQYQGTLNLGSSFLASSAAANLFVARFDAAGNAIWAQGTTGSGTSSAGGTGVAVDGAGNVDVAGFLVGSITFGGSGGGTTLSCAGVRDIVVAQYSATGALQWAQRLGGADFDQANALAIDAAGNVYTTGAFSGTVDFDPGPGVANLTSGGSYSVFISKLSSAGQFAWARALTISIGTAAGTGIAVEAGGRVDLTGWFQSTVDFDPGPGTAYLTSAGFEDVFVCELDSGGNYLASTRAGGMDFDAASGLAVNSSGAIALAGGYIGPSTFGSTTLANLGIANMFVAETVAMPPPAPGPPDLEPGSDSGVSNSDNLTNVAAPTLDVALADSANTVELLRDEVVVGSRVGPGAIVDQGPVPEGTHSYTARQRSAAGLVGPESSAIAVTFDFTPPPVPSAPSLLAADDSGTVGDGLTNVRQPHLVGTATAGVTVQLITGTGTVLGTAVAAAGGSYSVFVPNPLADGPYVLQARAQDAAGNLSPSSAGFSLTIDTVPPATPAAPALLPADDSGTPGDGITNVRQPHFTGTAEPGSLVRLVGGSGNTLGTTVAGTNGSYVVQVASPLTDGIYTFQVSAQDAAGNASGLSAAYWLRIDTSTTTPPALLAADDSGTKGDGLTNVRQPHLVGTSQPLFTIQVVDGSGTVRGSAPAAADGSYSVQVSSPLSDGSYALRAQAVDSTGLAGPASPAFSLVIDTTPPAAPPAPSLLSSDDSGTLGDGITSVRQPHLVGTAEAGATVQLITGAGTVLGTAVVPAGGAYTVQVQSPLADGVYSVQARAQDAAGNLGPAGPSLSLTIDATPPATPAVPALLVTDDSGVPGDGITNVRQPRLTGTAEAGSLVRLVDGTGTTLGTAVATSSGSYSVQPASALADGVYSLSVRAQDAAGNTSGTSPALSLKIDATAPAPPGPPALLAADDSGAKLDGITNVRQPHLIGTAEPLSTVRVFDTNSKLWGTATAGSDGSYTMLVTAAMPDATYLLSASANDAAGNASSPSAAFRLVIDTVAPAAPTAPALAVSDDSAVVGDRVTNVRQPHFVGAAEPGSEVMLLRAGTLVGTVSAAPDGSYSVQPATAFGDGSYSLAVQAEDAAGNLSASSSSATFVIDTTPPATPPAPALAPGDDSGQPGDGITNVRQPHFTGTAEPGSSVQLLDASNRVLASGQAAVDGSFVLMPSTSWSDGTFSVRVRAQDAAGNWSGTSSACSVVIDTVAPPAPAVPGMLAADDTGVAGDGVTAVRRPHLVGTAEALSTVDLLDGTGQVAASTVAAGDGSFTVQAPNDLPLGTTTWRVQARDAAGNQGAPGPALAISRITVASDFDGDGRADLAVYRSSTAQWLILGSRSGGRIVQFGAPGLDLPVPADYDGTGQTEIAVFRPTTGQWFIQGVSGGRVVQFGAPGDIPLPADYDGDGKADLAVYRPSTAQWFLWGTESGPRVVQFGAANLDLPVPADFDGDGKTDLAVFRPTTAQWFVLRTSAGGEVIQFGAGNLDRPIPADYDGDGKADIAVFRPTTAQWFLLRSSAGGQVMSFGAGNLDQPVPADFDGDGKADLAVFRPSTAQWFVLRSTAGPLLQQFGGVGIDQPLLLPSSYRWAGRISASAVRAASRSGATPESDPLGPSG